MGYAYVISKTSRIWRFPDGIWSSGPPFAQLWIHQLDTFRMIYAAPVGPTTISPSSSLPPGIIESEFQNEDFIQKTSVATKEWNGVQRHNKDASCKCKPDPIFCFQTNHNTSTPVTAIFSFLHIYCVLFTFSVIVIGPELLFRFSDKLTAQDIVAMSLKRFSWFITLTQ